MKAKYWNFLFSKIVSNSNEVIAHYLKDISLPKLTEEQSERCEGEITKNEVQNALKNMICKKTPRNSGITSEFYEAF